jgi:serine/threonine-protein kinase RIO1
MQAIIIDIDGTVAEKYPPRDIHDLTKVAYDYPIWPTIKAIEGLISTGKYAPIFVSGRQKKAAEATKQWLLHYISFLPYEYHFGTNILLFMRNDNDNRCDTIVKREIYENHIKEYYDVFCVFDDRKKVIDMWRSLGLFVFDCAQKDNNF